ncbi:glutathione synthase [Magnetovibrio sp.]|uniref:glutathione synthase n=1 Tax=Magnetovibrio sp. TaxID=2024836 RepID=UPI002F93D72C
MTLKVALQMDPITGVDIDADSTFVIGLEAQNRGHELFYYHPDDLLYEDGRVMAHAQRLELRRELGNHCTLGTPELVDLSTMDVVWLRQDPPFDMAYLTTTYLLDMLPDSTLVVNNPTQVRANPEKLYIARFPDLVPPTLVTRNVAHIKAFREKHSDIIVKPLYGNGGAGVFHVKPDDENLGSLLEMFLNGSREPIVVQAYLKDVRQGDKRIILIDGEPVGAINRIPPEGEARSNMHAGGTPEPCKLNERDLEICAAIGGDLKARGLIFAGIDVIGNYLTEINVTSPTGLQEIRRFDGVALEQKIWDAIEAKLAV